MSGRSRILIVGGYGKVGSRIAAELASEYPGRVIVAGRDPAKARALADGLGLGVDARRMNVDEPSAIEVGLDGVSLVVNCIDQQEPHLLRSVVRQGLAYTDITAYPAFFRRALSMDSEATASGARVLLGAGLTPGISNVMVRSGCEQVGEAECVHTAVLLSMGDNFGPAALDYMLRSAAEPFVVTEADGPRTVLNFTEGRRVTFPAPIGRRKAYRFALPDQFFYPQTLDVHTSAARIVLDPPWVTAVCAGAMRLGGAPLLRGSALRRALVRLLDRLQAAYVGQDTFALLVEVQGSKGTARLSLVGRDESFGTALGAALMARALYEREVDRPGVWLPEQVIVPGPFFERLAARGLQVVPGTWPKPS